jgi:carbonic anhydrase
MVHFLSHDNLHNRYDHFILAGSSLCACVDQTKKKFKPEVLEKYNDFGHWQQNLKDHIELAFELHHIEDVYIIEHRNCGAYKEFLKDGAIIDSDPIAEFDAHTEFARRLAKHIRKNINHSLSVHSFLINLRGDVEHLESFPA